MTTLTPNRIIQQGDEYRNNGTWKAVPKEDYGLQVMFTKYPEVRRPSETTKSTNGATTTAPVEPERAIPPKPAEAEILPDIGHPDYLPTIISKKAHQDAIEHPDFVGHEPPEVLPSANTSFTPAEIQTAIETIATGGGAITNIKFPPPSSGVLDEQPIWTGRNGTFTGYGLELMKADSKIMMSPKGKRGVGNCTIQFPISVIPEIVDWLEDQYKGTPK